MVGKKHLAFAFIDPQENFQDTKNKDHIHMHAHATQKCKPVGRKAYSLDLLAKE